jgi:hypothetical protein
VRYIKHAIRIGLLGLSCTSLSPAISATEREGTTTLLSPSEIADLKQWIDNAKNDLLLLQDDVRRSNLEKRRSDIVREFEMIINRSSRKENELLMRYSLNRALEINELVGNDPAPSELQTLVAFLDETIELSKTLYTDDQKYIAAIGRGDTPQLQTPMTVFAYQYAQNILQFSRTFLRPQLEYEITFKALGWLANDLNSPRNLQRIQFSETIHRIARLQSRFSQKPEGSDQKILQAVRTFKWEYRERVIKHLESVNADIRDAQKRAEQKLIDEQRLARMEVEERKKEELRLARIKERENRTGRGGDRNSQRPESLEGKLATQSRLYEMVAKHENGADDANRGIQLAKRMAEKHNISDEEAIEGYSIVISIFGSGNTNEALAYFEFACDHYLSIALKREKELLNIFSAVAPIMSAESAAADAVSIMANIKPLYEMSRILISDLTKSVATVVSKSGNGNTQEFIGLFSLGVDLFKLKISWIETRDAYLTILALENGPRDAVAGMSLIRDAVEKKGADFQDALGAYTKILARMGSGNTTEAQTAYKTLVGI